MYTKVVFINYSASEHLYRISIFLKNAKGIVHISSSPFDIDNYPYLSQKLKEGNMVYINAYDGYVGLEEKEGPYNEKEVFNSLYESHNDIMSELLINLDKNIRDDNQVQRKLVKIGNFYK